MPTQGYDHVSTNRGVVLDIQMLEGVGTYVHDLSERHLCGTLNAPTWVAGKNGRALSFNGIADVVDFLALDHTGFTGITIEILLYRNTHDIRVFPISCGYTPWQFEIWNTNLSGLEVDIDGAYYHFHGASTPQLVSGQWWHLALTHDLASGAWQFFVDGVGYDSGVQAGTAYTGANILRLGTQVGDVSFFDGLIDQARIYSRALSAEEIKTRYNLTR